MNEKMRELIETISELCKRQDITSAFIVHEIKEVILKFKEEENVVKETHESTDRPNHE